MTISCPMCSAGNMPKSGRYLNVAYCKPFPHFRGSLKQRRLARKCWKAAFTKIMVLWVPDGAFKRR